MLDRRAVRRALRGVDRVFHCAGITSVRPEDGERLFEVNVGGTKLVLEECLRAEVERVVYTSSAAALGPAARGETADETQLFTGGDLGIPYVSSVHEAEVEAMRLAARGLPLVCVNPAVCFGAGDHLLDLDPPGALVPARPHPGLHGRRDLVVDVRDVAAGHLLADRRGQVGERYILGGRNFTFDRLFADLGRLSGIEPPVQLPRRRRPVAAGVLASAGRTQAAHAAGGARGQPVVDLPLDARRAASWAGARVRTRRRSRPRSPGTWSASRIGSPARAARSSSSTASPARRSARPRAPSGGCGARTRRGP